MKPIIKLSLSFQIVALVVASGVALSGTKGDQPQGDYSGASTEFHAADKSFSTRVPAGLKSRTIMAGAQRLYVFEPEGGGEERILVSSGVAAVNSIQELAQQAMALTNQLFPGLRPTAAASFSQVANSPAAEISYSGMSAKGDQVIGWNGVILKERFYFAVLGLARAQDAKKIEQQSRFILRNMRPGEIKENVELVRAIVGRWTYYEGSSSGAGSSRSSSSVNRQVTFYPNGRFQYMSAVYVDTNMPGGLGGTAGGDKTTTGRYKVYGNTLFAEIDNGGQAVFGLELLRGGALKIDGLTYIRE
jgi:hypothetical protein